jgi:NAD(P)-dependent dehydrogenase (short-subunit alcohol dehydrogenase family)
MGTWDGRVALVTGAASGIGRAVAQRIAREGGRVVVADLDEAGGTESAAAVGGTFVRTDVSDLSQLEAAVTEAVDSYGRLDLVHLNAGIATGEWDMERVSVDAYRRALGVNVDGVVFGVMASAPALTSGGAIVATASLAGLVAHPADPVYGLTKHAVVGFVRAVADQLATKDIRINAICPGFTDTPILDSSAGRFREAGFPLLSADEVADAVLQVAASDGTGDVYVCQPGRTCVRYEFRGVPGPRVPGAEGMRPPFEVGG